MYCYVMINISRVFILFFVLSFLQACSSIKAPYASLLHSVPTVIKTSVGNVEVLNTGKQNLTKAKSPKGTSYLIPGFPGSSLENMPLAQALSKKGYTVYLLNPPGHGRVAIENPHWQFQFPQYAQALDESLRTLQSIHKENGEQVIIAHSAGAEMVFQLLLSNVNKRQALPRFNKIILINPWLPSISNASIPWTSKDEDLLIYPTLLVKLLGPFSKTASYKRLFLNPQQKQNRDYLAAHEKLTENLGGWWPFDSRFVRLMKGTTRTQKAILEQNREYQQSKNDLAPLNKQLNRIKTQLIIINSANGLDHIIPSTYKQLLQKALREKLPNVTMRFIEVKNSGHMLQVEQTGQVANQLFLDNSRHQE